MILRFRQLLSRITWSVAMMVLLALFVAGGAVDIARRLLEQEHRVWLGNEARRSAIELMGQTLNGKIMGSMNVLGLVIPEVKIAANSEEPVASAAVTQMIEAIGRSYGADGVFIVGRAGKITASWDIQGRSNFGLDVKFRSYFQMAMQGKDNVYAAVSISTGERVLYFSAPIYPDAGSGQPIGAAVARVPVARIEPLLSAWTTPAALLTPQGVVFAANREGWIYRSAGEVDDRRIKEIRAIRQFGKMFDAQVPEPMPIDVGAAVAEHDGMRLAVEKVPVAWNDPGGEWALVLTSDLGTAMPPGRKWLVGGVAGLVALALQWLALSLFRSRRQREVSMRAVQANAEAAQKRARLQKQLATISLQLQQQDDLAELARTFLTATAFHLGMRQGTCYLADHDGNKLQLLATYASGEGSVPQEVAFGDGPLGQCAIDKQPFVLDVPDQSAWKIASGLGSMMPTALVVAPVIMNDMVLAVVELALLKPLDASRRQLLDELLPLLGLNIQILRHQSSSLRESWPS